jgi:hypothetical protein
MGRRMTLAPDNIASSIGWELFSHDADVGVRGFGATVAEAFEGAALALTAVITDAPIAPNTRVDVACEAPDIELLLVEWLNAVIYEMAVPQRCGIGRDGFQTGPGFRDALAVRSRQRLTDNAHASFLAAALG